MDARRTPLHKVVGLDVAILPPHPAPQHFRKCGPIRDAQRCTGSLPRALARRHSHPTGEARHCEPRRRSASASSRGNLPVRGVALSARRPWCHASPRRLGSSGPGGPAPGRSAAHLTEYRQAEWPPELGPATRVLPIHAAGRRRRRSGRRAALGLRRSFGSPWVFPRLQSDSLSSAPSRRIGRHLCSSAAQRSTWEPVVLTLRALFRDFGRPLVPLGTRAQGPAVLGGARARDAPRRWGP